MKMTSVEDVRPDGHPPINPTSMSTLSSPVTLGEAAYRTDGTLSALSLVRDALLCLVFLGNILLLAKVICSRTIKPAARWMIGNLAVRDVVFDLAQAMRSEFFFLQSSFHTVANFWHFCVTLRKSTIEKSVTLI